jgi:hypothetical protein
MRRLILILVAVVGLVMTTAAQIPDSVTLKTGQQKSASRSKLRIRFVAVTEDSRCPLGTNCIWAGNAKVKFEVTDRRGKRQMFEVNTSIGPKGDTFDSWAVDLISLTPSPREGKKVDPRSYIAKFTITRLQR